MLHSSTAPLLGTVNAQAEPPVEQGSSLAANAAHALSPTATDILEQAPPFPQDDTLQRRPEETQT